VAYEKKGARDRAIADFRKAIELHPGYNGQTAVLKRLGSPIEPAPSGAGAQETGHGQIILKNQTSMTLDMRVNGRQACQPAANHTCTSEQKAGKHLLTAFHEGRSVVSKLMVLKEGATWTWTVAGLKSPPQ
jgi:hypothetical protein